MSPIPYGGGAIHIIQRFQSLSLCQIVPSAWFIVIFDCCMYIFCGPPPAHLHYSWRGGGSHRACTLRGPPGGPIYSTPYGPCPYRPTVGNPTTQPKCQYTKAKHTFLAEMVSGQHAVSFRHDGRWGNVKEGNWGQEEVVFVSFRRTTSRRTLTSKTGEGRELGAGGGFFPFRRTPSQRMLTRKTGEGRELGEGAVFFFPFRRTPSQRTLTSKTGEGKDFLVQGPISGALNQNALYSSPSDDELSPASLRFLGVYHSNKQRCD